MRRTLTLLLAILLITLTSCSLIMPENQDWDIHFLSVALSYNTPGNITGTKYTAGTLSGTLNDQIFLDRELAYLSDESGLDYDAIMIQNGTVDENYTNKDSQNQITRKVGSEETSRTDISPEEFLKQVEDAIDELAATVDPLDVLIFHYSGHGSSEGGDIVLPLTASTYQLYSLDNLLSRLDRIDCYKVIILDSCYSGNAVDEDDRDNRTSFASLFEKYSGSVTKTWVLAAAASDALSYDVPSGEYKYTLGRHISVVLEAMGFNLGAFTEGRRDSDFLSMNKLIERIPEEEGYGPYIQRPQSTISVRDLILFDF